MLPLCMCAVVLSLSKGAAVGMGRERDFSTHALVPRALGRNDEVVVEEEVLGGGYAAAQHLFFVYRRLVIPIGAKRSGGISASSFRPPRLCSRQALRSGGIFYHERRVIGIEVASLRLQ
ncbi:MAG: hypothetical protein LBK47_03050 [Prevotellaceae bacterium]|nr:hypothetical protein [Prevotellaceae bacterium]